MAYDEMNSLMEADYDQTAQQAKFHAEIEVLHLPIFMRENETSSLPEGLKIIFDRVKELTRQAPLTFNDEQNKILHLRLLSCLITDINYQNCTSWFSYFLDFRILPIYYCLVN